MKENKYDDIIFFEKYSKFPRSVEGLNAAGEWHEFQKLIPDFNGKRVLDIGCGFGWHCIYAAENGADYILGIDISEKMLSAAREKIFHKIRKDCKDYKNIEYRKMAMEDISLLNESFDVIVSSLAFHYTPDFEKICKDIYNLLVPDGNFIFSVEHPVFTAYGSQDWIYGCENKKEHWPVDSYFYEGNRESVFLGEKVIKYHKTITTYLGSLLSTGFMITGIVEPKPEKSLLESVPDMKDELRRPMMLIVSARK